ncbi:MAG: alpha amylase C-terminal domain-containing protein [Acidimicrobiia bacterium]|nr:alpha amylase C-terminal domain-containing protein [Acidimicrobiia bacterium]
MGAIPYPGGVAFRVWAPHAEAVSVVGTFSGGDCRPLAAEGNGYWSADVPGAGPGDRYTYRITAGGEVLSRIDPYARLVTHSAGEAVVVDLSRRRRAPFHMPGWHDLVVYELHVGTFHDLPGGDPGQFRAAAQKLPYLASLGVNAVELMPTTEFATDYSWGYNPANPFAVEEAYGGPEGLMGFIDAAHAHDIAVLVDVVYNHWGPGDNALWRFDGWGAPGKGGIYFYPDHRSHTPWGDRPDYGRPEVRRYIRDNALMWLEDYRADGLRWDATAYIRDVDGGDGSPGTALPDGWGLMQWVNDEIDARQPWKPTIAEDLRGNPALTRPTAAGGAGFDMQWDGGFAHVVRGALVAPDDTARDLVAVAGAIGGGAGADPLRRVIYTESHDEVANGKARLPEEIWPGQADSWAAKKRSTLGAALVLTAPGVPMLFQGQEMLEDRWFHDRDPVDWSRRERFSGIVALYRDLISLRRNLRGTTAGLQGRGVAVHHVDTEVKVLAFHRWDRGGPGDDVLVVANFADRAHAAYTIGFPREGRWRVRLNSDWAGYDASFGSRHAYDTDARPGAWDGLPFHGDVGLGPYGVLILSQDG